MGGGKARGRLGNMRRGKEGLGTWYLEREMDGMQGKQEL